MWRQKFTMRNVSHSPYNDQIGLPVNAFLEGGGACGAIIGACDWSATTLGHMIGHVFRVRIDGPEIRLRPSCAQALALILHELATNAVKYGSLSVNHGQLQVNWSILPGEEGARQFELRWTELGGPATSPPSRKGFGSKLIRNSVERQLGGALDLDWRAEGLTCIVQLPAEQVEERATSPQSFKELEISDAPTNTELAGKRILLVEDEVLIALEMSEVLAALGCEILGPAASVQDAMNVLDMARPDAAIVDVNLAGELNDVVVNDLKRRKIPFAYCTGYSDDFYQPSDQNPVPVLQKPVDPHSLTEMVRHLVSETELGLEEVR